MEQNGWGCLPCLHFSQLPALSLLFLHPGKFLVEERCYILKQQQQNKMPPKTKNKQYKTKKIKNQFENWFSNSFNFLHGSKLYISRCKIKVKVLCLVYILMSHLKYPHLELNSLQFECFLYCDFKDDPRVPDPVFCRTPCKEYSERSLNYTFLGRIGSCLHSSSHQLVMDGYSSCFNGF